MKKKQNYRKPSHYNYVCSTTPSANLIIGFSECPSNPVPHIEHWRSNYPVEEISENEA